MTWVSESGAGAASTDGTLVMTVRSGVRGDNQDRSLYVLCSMAQRSIELRPKIAAISNKASVSSFELKHGNLCVRIDKSITPADQMSRASVSFEQQRIRQAYRQSGPGI